MMPPAPQVVTADICHSKGILSDIHIVEIRKEKVSEAELITEDQDRQE